MPSLKIAGYEFGHVCDIEPVTADGVIAEFSPQARYRNPRNIPLNKYGAGTFCRFRLPPTAPRDSGVYVITVDKAPGYVGECRNLAMRYNTGYGQISPRKCFAGGQETNCRVNRLILEEKRKGRTLQLWFMNSADYKNIERQLRGSDTWPWNRV